MLNTATKSTTLFSLATVKQWLGVTSNLTKAISSLSSSGLVATAVSAAHGYVTGQFAIIAGASPAGYNLPVLLTVVDANTFTYPLAATVSSPATGSPTVTPDDGRVAAMADAASAELEKMLDLYFVKRSVTETLNGTDKIALALKYAPVVSIDSFTIGGSAVPAANYVLDTETGIITFTSGSFTGGTKNVVITYTAGYDVQDGAALPADIYRAGLDLTKAIHDELVSNAIAASSVSLGASTMVIKPSDYPPSVKRVIAAWEGQAMRA